jgi:hypothetical protein
MGKKNLSSNEPTMFCLALFFPAMAQPAQIPKLENPVSVEYLKAKLKSDMLVQNYYSYLKKQADSILEKPLLTHVLEGFRMLAVSREMVERMGVLCMVYRLEKKPEMLKRIEIRIPAWTIETGKMNLKVRLSGE